MLFAVTPCKPLRQLMRLVPFLPAEIYAPSLAFRRNPFRRCRIPAYLPRSAAGYVGAGFLTVTDGISGGSAYTRVLISNTHICKYHLPQAKQLSSSISTALKDSTDRLRRRNFCALCAKFVRFLVVGAKHASGCNSQKRLVSLSHFYMPSWGCVKNVF